MFAVAGVTGHTGAATAEALLAKGRKVRAIVRSADKAAGWAGRGCEVAVAALDDPGALAKALQGVQGAYLLSPPNFAATDFLADRKAFVEKMAEGVRKSRVPAIAFLSSVGAQHAAGTGPIVTAHRAEAILKDAAPSATFLRAAYFLENWGAVMPVAKGQGVLPHFGRVDVPFPQICARDIGEAASAALVASAAGSRVIEIAGQRDWSVEQIAQALSGLLGKPIKAASAPVSAARAGLEQAGLPPEMARLYAEMYAGIEAGLVAFERPQAVWRGPTPLAEALRPLI